MTRASLVALGLAAALAAPLSSPAAAADPPPNAFVQSSIGGGTVVTPVAAADTADGGLTLGATTITPPLGTSFAPGTFLIGANRDATHGTLSSTSCPSGSGTATVKEAAGDAVAVDVVATLCGGPYGISFRRASTTPYAVGLLTTDVPTNVPYAGGSYTATLSNLGTADLVPGTMSVGSVVGATVTLSSDTCDGTTLHPTETCTVGLSVTPVNGQARFTLSAPVPALPLGALERTVTLRGGTVPSAPRNLHLVAAALNRALLAWDPPTDDGGNPLHYNLSSKVGYAPSYTVSGTTAVVSLSQLSAFKGITVRAYSSAGLGPNSDPIDIPARSGDALLVRRPDGREWASEVATPDEAVPTDLVPDGGSSQMLWVGNKDGRVRATDLYGYPYGGDAGPLGSDFTPDGISGLLYVRPDAQGNPAVVTNGFGETDNPVPYVVRRGYTQPTSSGTWMYAVPATKSGPTGGPLIADRRDGYTSVLLRGTEGATHPAASTDGRWLAYVQPKAGGGQLLRLRSAGPRDVRVLTSTLPLVDVTSLSWSLDASSLYVYDDGTHLLTRVPVDPSTGLGTPEVIGSGDTAGPARVVSERTFNARPQLPEGGMLNSPRNAGAVIVCRLDGAVLPCGGDRFDPHTSAGQHTWTMTETIAGRVPITWGYTGITFRTERDFTGDGKADFAVFRPRTGQWFVRGRPSVQWGRRGDVPLTNDFDGDGKVDYAVFRPSTRTWYVRGKAPVQFGAPGDLPVAADYTGDGKDDLAVYRPSTHQWFVRGRPSVQLGGPGDVPLVGHWWFGPYDGKERPAVCRPSTQLVYVQGLHSQPASTCPYPDTGRAFAYDQVPGWTDIGSFADGRIVVASVGPVPFGSPSDIPVVGDYTGYAGAEIVLFRPSTGRWYMRGHSTTQFGGPGDIPL